MRLDLTGSVDIDPRERLALYAELAYVLKKYAAASDAWTLATSEPVGAPA